MPAPTYQSISDQQTAAALQAYVATPASLVSAGAARGSYESDRSSALAQRQAQATMTYGAEALQGNVQMVTLLNESLNANQFMNTTIDAETRRVSGMEKSVKNEQFKLRNQVMMNQYLIGYYRVAAFVMKMTLVVTLLLLLPAALWRAGRMNGLLFAAVALLVVLVYLAALVVTVARTSMRRTDAWNEMNWRMSKKLAAQLKAASQPNTTCTSDGTVAGDSAGPLSCADASAQYKTLYSTTMQTASQLPGVSAQALSWADYLVGGQTNYWPGQTCYAQTTCDDAKAIYQIMYPSTQVGVSVNQDHLNHPERVWATSTTLC